MGHSTYCSTDARATKAFAKGYHSKSTNEIFIQNKKREVHKDMDPKNVDVRECRDSDAHPNTVPLMLYLDVTGSMGHIPHQLIKDGLPTMVTTIIQRGVEDVALMFGAIGDHECDNVPLQVAQFESGDEELDMWLERTFLEGGGGGNAGESYLLAWYFSAFHTSTDALEKRNKRGIVITVGDEPFLKSLPKTACKAIMGDTCSIQDTMSAEDLYNLCSAKNFVYHIHCTHEGRRPISQGWKDLLGQNAIEIDDHTELAKVVADLVLQTTGFGEVLEVETNDVIKENASPAKEETQML